MGRISGLIATFIVSQWGLFRNVRCATRFDVSVSGKKIKILWNITHGKKWLRFFGTLQKKNLRN